MLIRGRLSWLELFRKSFVKYRDQDQGFVLQIYLVESLKVQSFKKGARHQFINCEQQGMLSPALHSCVTYVLLA